MTDTDWVERKDFFNVPFAFVGLFKRKDGSIVRGHAGDHAIYTAEKPLALGGENHSNFVAYKSCDSYKKSQGCWTDIQENIDRWISEK
jgi:hypothetical protein